MLAHLLSQDAHANAGEVIDRKSSIPRVICGEDTIKARAEYFIIQALLKFGHAEHLCEVLEQDLDKYPAAGCGFIFIQVHHR